MLGLAPGVLCWSSNDGEEGGGVYLRILKIRCTRCSFAVDGIEKSARGGAGCRLAERRIDDHQSIQNLYNTCRSNYIILTARRFPPSVLLTAMAV